MRAAAPRLKPMTPEQRRQVKAALDVLERELTELEGRLRVLEADVEKKAAERDGKDRHCP